MTGAGCSSDSEKLLSPVPIASNTRGSAGKSESIYMQMTGLCSGGTVSLSFLRFEFIVLQLLL